MMRAQQSPVDIDEKMSPVSPVGTNYSVRQPDMKSPVEHFLSRSANHLFSQSMIIEAEQLLDQLRPLIFMTRPSTNYRSWPWLPVLMGRLALCEEVLDAIRTRAATMDSRREHSTSLTSDYESVRHLPTAIRNHYHPIFTTPDGSCFFNSVSLLLIGDEQLTRVLRLLSVYLYIKHREGLRRLMDDDLLLSEIRKTCIVREDAECTDPRDCWAEFMNVIVMAEIIQRPLLLIDFSDELHASVQRRISIVVFNCSNQSADCGYIIWSWTYVPTFLWLCVPAAVLQERTFCHLVVQ